MSDKSYKTHNFTSVNVYYLSFWMVRTMNVRLNLLKIPQRSQKSISWSLTASNEVKILDIYGLFRFQSSPIFSYWIKLLIFSREEKVEEKAKK